MSRNNYNFEGMEHSSLETTAIEAQMNAPTRVEAMDIFENVERAKNAADQAASVAKSSFTREPATAVDQLKTDASRTTEAAVSEGRRDVEQAKTIGVGYVEQAKSLANSAVETAQNYLPAALGGKPVGPVSTSQEAPNLVDQVRNTAADLYATALSTAEPPTDKLKGATSAVTDAHVGSSDEIAQSTFACSHIETAKSVAIPHLEDVKQSGQAAVDSALPRVENAKAKVQGSMGIGADVDEDGTLSEDH